MQAFLWTPQRGRMCVHVHNNVLFFFCALQSRASGQTSTHKKYVTMIVYYKYIICMCTMYV